MQPGPADADAPPPGTAVVRPLRHVRNVREHYLRRFTDPAAAAASRSVRAWSWALGETATAPVTDRQTPTPPTRSDIEAEITEAERRRLLHGDRSSRADAATAILRWLIGQDDHVPVRAKNKGELVGGSGDVVRSPDQIASVLAQAGESRRRSTTEYRDASAAPVGWQLARQNADYLDGVAATLSWVLGERPEAPITQVHPAELTTRDLKTERLHAEDVVEQAGSPRETVRPLSAWYGEGVKHSITWLLGDSAAPPVEPVGRCS